MSLDTINNELSRLRREEAKLKKDLAEQEKIAADARSDALKKRGQASKSKTPSMVSTYLRQAETADKKLVAASIKIGTLSESLRKKSTSISSKEKSLRSALENEQKKKDNADTDRRRTEKTHAREMQRLSSPEIRFVAVSEPQPEKLRVLYLTASPDGEANLHVDKEIREVRNYIRGARHRDLIEIHHMSAAEPEDIIQGINDYRPHVIHFSGHGAPGLIFMDSGGPEGTKGVNVSFELLAQMLSATTTPPVLVVLNACETLEDAEILLNASPMVVAMGESITDPAAIRFSSRFYAAIASAQSVGAALDQARASLMILAQIDPDLEQENLTPDFIARDDIDINTQVLVKVPNDV